MRHKKGQLDNLGGLFQALGYLAILLAIIFLILANVKTQVEEIDPCTNTSHVYNSSSDQCCLAGIGGVANCTRGTGSASASLNATREVQGAVGDIPGWLPIIVIVVIGGVLLGLIQMFRRR